MVKYREADSQAIACKSLAEDIQKHQLEDPPTRRYLTSAATSPQDLAGGAGHSPPEPRATSIDQLPSIRYHARSPLYSSELKQRMRYDMAPIRIALLGSGIFAREAHAPALRVLSEEFEVVAIYSRSSENAAALAATFPQPVDLYTEVSELLARDDIEAVDSVLPIALQPAAIEAALRAGKHIMSEKPAAPDVAAGKHLLAVAEACEREAGRIWMVAENFRYAEIYQAARRSLEHGDIGMPVQLSWSSYSAMNMENRYYHTPWRRDQSFPGGFILDGGVHNIAAVRTVMGDIDAVSAIITQIRADLPPADTVSATLRFASGAVGTFSLTFVTGIAWESPMFVVGERGALRVGAPTLEIMSEGSIRRQSFPDDTIRAELADFAEGIRQGKDRHSTARQAVGDVAVIEAMFASAESGRFVKPETV